MLCLFALQTLLALPPQGVTSITAIADASPVVLAVSRSGGSSILSAASGNMVREAEGCLEGVMGADISPDGQLAAYLTVANDVYLWAWESEDRPRKVAELEGPANAWENAQLGSIVSFSPKGDRILIANFGGERLLLSPSGEAVARIPFDAAEVKVKNEDGWRSAHFTGFTVPHDWSSDGSHLALVTAGRPQLYDTRTGAPIGPKLEAFEPTAECVAIDAHGRYVAAGHFRGHVVLWSLATGKRVWTFEHQDPFFGKHDDEWFTISFGDLEFSPDGRWLAVTTTPGIHALLLDVASGTRAWMGELNGGRMGEPAMVHWTPGSEAFYHGNLGGGARLRRVELAKMPAGGESGKVEAWRPTPNPWTPVSRVRAAGRGYSIDIGWSGVMVGLDSGDIHATKAATGEKLWLHREPSSGWIDGLPQTGAALPRGLPPIW